ncbi:MAG TPA: preprotein translocase subunit SecG [Kofleriaceae bacterium]|nr:preprotein translocase subunit SecG [Kofleriaceae bacterium]
MTILHVLVCIFLMLTVLLQAGKGGGMGAAFGGGSSMGTVFGGSGAGNFLRRLTVSAAIIFMITSMTLAWLSTPSTDPLKKIWARSEQQHAAKERAHEEAAGPTVPAAAPSPAGAATTGSDDESATEMETPADEGATAPEGAATPSAATPTDKPAADKAGAATPADKPAADKPAADKAGAATPTDKPAADKPATDKPATPADKPGTTP